MPGAKVPLDPWPSNQALPALLTDRDLMRVVQLRPASFYVHKARGAFKRLEARGVAVGTTRYSGELVRDYVTCAPLAQFGRKKAS